MRATPIAITIVIAPSQTALRCTDELYGCGARFACRARMKYVALVAALLCLAACPSRSHEDMSQNSPKQTSTSTTPARTATVVQPQNDRPYARQGAAANQTVEVQLMEYSIRAPQSLAPGQYTFNVVNAGKEDHRFLLHGNGDSFWLDEPLKRGDSRYVAADLKPGKYEVSCPIDHHKQRGMSAIIDVK